jgi:hypothetical protein
VTQILPAPIVTTIIPTYRRPALLRRALTSVLSQGFPALRICVYDNGAEPATARVVEMFADPRIQYRAHPKNLGGVANFAFGLQRVQTPYFSFLSDDDLLLPGFYTTTVAALQKEPDAMFAATQVVIADGKGRMLSVEGRGWRPGLYRPPDGLLEMLRRGHISWTGILFRRELLEWVPGLDPETDPVIDIDFELRAAARTPFVICDRPGAILVLQSSSLSARARLSDTWPGWRKTMANLTEDASVPAAVRERVGRILDRQLAARVFRVGRAAARQGRIPEADQVADLLVDRYGRRLQALVLRRMARVCAALPPARKGLARLLDAYRVVSSALLRRSLAAATPRPANPKEGRKDAVTAALRSLAMEDSGGGG